MTWCLRRGYNLLDVSRFAGSNKKKIVWKLLNHHYVFVIEVFMIRFVGFYLLSIALNLWYVILMTYTIQIDRLIKVFLNHSYSSHSIRHTIPICNNFSVDVQWIIQITAQLKKKSHRHRYHRLSLTGILIVWTCTLYNLMKSLKII